METVESEIVGAIFAELLSRKGLTLLGAVADDDLLAIRRACEKIVEDAITNMCELCKDE